MEVIGVLCINPEAANFDPEMQWDAGDARQHTQGKNRTLMANYHSTFEITYRGFILDEFYFVIISAKITVQNSVKNYFCNVPCFFTQISVLLVAAARITNQAR